MPHYDPCEYHGYLHHLTLYQVYQCHHDLLPAQLIAHTVNNAGVSAEHIRAHHNVSGAGHEEVTTLPQVCSTDSLHTII